MCAHTGGGAGGGACDRSLLPPRLEAGAEVGFGPGGEAHFAVQVRHVAEGQAEGGGAAHHFALVVVLGPVARAHELVLRLVPRHHAAQVGAHRHQAVVLTRTKRKREE